MTKKPKRKIIQVKLFFRLKFNNMKKIDKVNVGKCQVEVTLNDGRVFVKEFFGSKPVQYYYNSGVFVKKTYFYDVHFITARQEAEKFIMNLNKIEIINNEAVFLKDFKTIKIINESDSYSDVIYEHYNRIDPY